MKTHEEVRELIAPYVLGAVSEEEAAAIRSHLLSCEECMAAADGYSAVSASLLLAVEPEPLPPGFTERVMAQAGRGSAQRPRSLLGSWTRLQILGTAALVLIALILAVGMLDARRDAAVNEQIVRELMASDRGLELWGEGEVRAKIIETRPGAMFVVHGLDEAPPGQTYQLWMMEGRCQDDLSDPRCDIWSGGLFDTRGGLALTWYRGSMDEVDRVAVTREPEGGSRQPTEKPVCISG